MHAPHRRGNWTIPVTARHTAHYLSRIIMNWFVNENTCFPALASIYAFHRVHLPLVLFSLSFSLSLSVSLMRLSFHPRFNPSLCPVFPLSANIYRQRSWYNRCPLALVCLQGVPRNWDRWWFSRLMTRSHSEFLYFYNGFCSLLLYFELFFFYSRFSFVFLNERRILLGDNSGISVFL